MSVEIRVNLEGVGPLLARLEGTSRRARDLRPAFQVIDRSVGNFFRKQFESGGRYGGSAWRPLAPSTLRRRLSKVSNPGGNRGGVNRPLWNTGGLKAALQEVGGNSVRVIEPKFYQRGTTLQRALYHQMGTRTIPQRPIIPDPLPRFLVADWENTLEKHLLGELE